MDSLLYELYGLTPEEIPILEEATTAPVAGADAATNDAEKPF